MVVWSGRCKNCNDDVPPYWEPQFCGTGCRAAYNEKKYDEEIRILKEKIKVLEFNDV